MRNWVIALSPNGRGWLTKFGLWMLRLKEFLDFPVYATAVWLMYVLTQEASAAGSTAALAGLVLIAFAAWLYGAVGLSEGQWRRFGVGLSTVAGIRTPNGAPEPESTRLETPPTLNFYILFFF